MGDIEAQELSRVEDLIFNGLINNDNYFYKVFPFLKEEYFDDKEKVIFKIFKFHHDKFDKKATPEILEVYLDKYRNTNETLFSAATEFFFKIKPERPTLDYDWLTDATEEYCQDKALYNALAKAVSIYDKETDEQPKSSIPEILQEALGVTFDNDNGLDYFEDAQKRFERLHLKYDKVPFLCDVLNEITDGGFELKTVNCFLSATNVGKSAMMTWLSTEYSLQGKKVLYLTMEMAEEKIAQRMDACLFNRTLSQVKNMGKDEFLGSVHNLTKKGMGKIIVKEFPTSTVHMGHVEAYLRELKLKKNFEPDVVMLDYLNICLSKRVSLNKGTYMFVKSIAEEFRGLAVKNNFCGITAVQGDRSTIESSDIGLQNVGESKGINDTVDFMLGLMAPEEIKAQGIMLCKQLKSRYGDVNRKKRFALIFDSEKMKFEDSENLAIPGFNAPKDGKQESDTPIFDRGTNNRILEERPDITGDATKALLSGGIKW